MSPAETPPPDRPALFLASASPRRLDLLRQLGIEPAGIVAADTDESVHPAEPPRTYVSRIAAAKLAATASRVPDGALLLAADTAVCVGRRILPKTEDERTARATVPTLDTLRSFFKPAPISSQEIDK